ncbi:MAG: helicase HerA-like domain-containing protein [Candidatus Methanomethyliaceae archaeon]
MIDLEYIRLLEFLRFSGRENDEELLEVIKAAIVSEDKRFLRSLTRLLELEATEQLVRQDAFFPYPPRDVVKGPVRVGVVTRTKDEFGLYPEELNRGLLVCGSPGTGKTNLVELIVPQVISQGIKVFIADIKRDYIPLASAVHELCLMDISEFRFNPLEAPSGSDPHRYAQLVANIYRKAMGVLTAGEGVFYQSILELYDIFGITKGSEEFPTLFDLLEYEKNRKGKRFDPEAEAREREVNRLLTITSALGQTINCSKGIPIEKLLENNVVLLLDRLNPEVRAFILGCILTAIYSYRMSKNEKSALKNVLIIDDCKSLLPIQEEKRVHQGIPTFTEFLTQSREYGFGHILTDHLPTFLASAAKAASYAKILLPLGRGEDYWDMARCMGLNEEQLEEAHSLKEYEAIVKLAGRWTKPFKIEIYGSGIKRVVDEERIKRKNAPIIEELTKDVRLRKEKPLILIKEAHTLEQNQSYLTSDEQELLKDVAKNPFLFLSQRKERLRWPWQKLCSTISRLERKGFVEVVTIHLGRRGPPSKLLELKPKALEWLRSLDGRRNFEVFKGVKGGIVHAFWCQRLALALEKKGYKVELEAELKKGVFADCLARKDGKVIAIEVECSSNGLRNVEKYHDFFNFIDHLFVAVVDKTRLREIKGKLRNPGSDEKVKVMDVRELIASLESGGGIISS